MVIKVDYKCIKMSRHATAAIAKHRESNQRLHNSLTEVKNIKLH